MKVIGLLCVLVFAGCSFIGGGAAPVGTHTSDGNDISMFSDAVTKGMSRVQSNLHLAVDKGELAADDPAIPCVDAIVGTPSTDSREYDNNGALAEGSILYIKANGIRSKQKGLQTSCRAIIGDIVIQGMNRGR